MKITIAYLPGEERNAGIIRAFVEGLFSETKVRESERHSPYKHIYLATKKTEKSCGSKEKL